MPPSSTFRISIRRARRLRHRCHRGTAPPMPTDPHKQTDRHRNGPKVTRVSVDPCRRPSIRKAVHRNSLCRINRQRVRPGISAHHSTRCRLRTFHPSTRRRSTRHRRGLHRSTFRRRGLRRRAFRRRGRHRNTLRPRTFRPRTFRHRTFRRRSVHKGPVRRRTLRMLRTLRTRRSRRPHPSRTRIDRCAPKPRYLPKVAGARPCVQCRAG